MKGKVFNKNLADICPIPSEDVDGVRNEWIRKVHAIITSRIYAGFTAHIQEYEGHVNYDLYDQINMSNMKSDAIMHVMVNHMPTATLMDMFGLNTDGSVVVPAGLKDEWSRDWTIIVNDIPRTISLTIRDVLELAHQAEAHKYSVSKEMRDKYIAPLMECTTIAQINKTALDLHIDKQYISAI